MLHCEIRNNSLHDNFHRMVDGIGYLPSHELELSLSYQNEVISGKRTACAIRKNISTAPFLGCAGVLLAYSFLENHDRNRT